MNPAGADEAGGEAAVVGGDAVAEVEDPGRGRTLSWGQERDSCWGNVGWVGTGRGRQREILRNALRGHGDPED